jgi:hypothetical protein
VRADMNCQHAVDQADGLPDAAASHAVRERVPCRPCR